MMAASVYATPPPDLSGEETALSDASNSSQTNSSSLSKKRTLSATSTPGPVTPGSTNLLDTTPDLSKKRRKQSTPIRISASNGNNGTEGTTETTTNGDATEEASVGDSEENLKNGEDEEMPEIKPQETIDLDAELTKVEPKERGEISCVPLSQLNEKREELNDTQIPLDALKAIELLKKHEFAAKKSPKQDSDEQEEVRDKSPDIKKEEIMTPEWDGEIKRKFPSKPEEWLQLTGLPFPFTPETAAALQASGCFPQLPMFGQLPPVPTFTSSDGTRPANIPPRIFNPEAYCELCNKEFCNKYFLKTHKANKHGIYEPPVSNTDMASLNQIGQQMSQLLQMQQQQRQQQEQVMNQVANNEMNSQGSNSPTSALTPQSILSIENTVYCDVCFKKFNNVFAMRKHRSKVHETPVNGDNGNSTKSNSDGEKQEEGNPSSTNSFLKLPDGFREDYSVEQEDVSFTPQPRKLSPMSIQQAREANFAFDKLKRLGVINPEAFCELCGKEYCNKYFLRTHKLKRHGILPTPEETKDDQLSSIRNAERAPWHHIQTSPLNLMVSGLDPNMPLLRQPQNDDSSDNNSDSPKDNSMKQESSNIVTDEEKLSQPRTPTNNQDPDAISVDLQKLQSMIMQLNDLNAHRAAQCTICGKEMENRYLLHAHMLSEHSGLVGDNNNGIKSPGQESSPIPMGQEFEICKLCDKEFSNVFMLKQHVIEVHGMQNDLSPIRDGFVTPDRPMMPLNLPSTPGPNDRRPPYTMTPTSSYCEICNKELCNKYFMKTHMQRMHGIEIENGAQIGGVVCNICNKELCSKYFLRVHKHNTHGIVDEGSPLPPAATRMNGENSLDTESGFSQDANLKPGEVGEMSNRYFSHFTEVCPLCSRRFRSSKWLKAHLMSDHGKAGTDKLKELETKMSLNKPPSPGIKIPNGAFGLPSPDQNLLSKSALSGLFSNAENMASSSQSVRGYQCSQCSFSTPILPFLFIHERSHQTINMPPQPPLQSESAVSLAKDQQQRASQPTSAASSNETPTSTPASTPIPLAAQEPNLSINPVTLIGKPPPMNVEPLSILNEMANLTQRPAVYALPQEAGPFVMQSFLVEETNDQKLNNGANSNKKFVPVVVFLPVKERIVSPVNVSFTLTPA